MNHLITETFPATLHEVAYLRAEQEARPWYVVHRPKPDEIGATADLADGDEVFMVCAPD